MSYLNGISLMQLEATVAKLSCFFLLAASVVVCFMTAEYKCSLVLLLEEDQESNGSNTTFGKWFVKKALYDDS